MRYFVYDARKQTVNRLTPVLHFCLQKWCDDNCWHTVWAAHTHHNIIKRRCGTNTMYKYNLLSNRQNDGVRSSIYLNLMFLWRWWWDNYSRAVSIYMWGVICAMSTRSSSRKNIINPDADYFVDEMFVCLWENLVSTRR